MSLCANKSLTESLWCYLYFIDNKVSVKMGQNNRMSRETFLFTFVW